MLSSLVLTEAARRREEALTGFLARRHDHHLRRLAVCKRRREKLVDLRARWEVGALTRGEKASEVSTPRVVAGRAPVEKDPALAKLVQETTKDIAGAADVVRKLVRQSGA